MSTAMALTGGHFQTRSGTQAEGPIFLIWLGFEVELIKGVYLRGPMFTIPIRH
jgi:hypothetical protein